MFRLATLAFALLIAGCAPALAPEQRAALDRAAEALDARLGPAATLAATAAAIHDRDGRFPDTPFALLADPIALETGARALNLSALDLEPQDGTLRLDYILLPTREDPTDRLGSLTIRPGTERAYAADVLLRRTEDPDHGGRPLPVERAEPFQVRQLSGRMALDLAAAAPERPYPVTFTPAPSPFAPELPTALGDGYTVRVGS